MKMIKKFFALSLILTLVSSCTSAALFLSSSATFGTAVAQERSVGQAVDDLSVWTRIKNAFFQEKESTKLFSKIGVKVLEGRVLLTGTVSNNEEKITALKIVWSQNGVHEVINELKVDRATNKGGLGNLVKDSWITTQIKSKVLLHNKIKSINYSVETIDNIVYIMGIADSSEELTELTSIAGKVKGVERVISYVRVKDSKIRKEMLKSHF